jgi:hypothetical protein
VDHSVGQTLSVLRFDVMTLRTGLRIILRPLPH